MANEYDDRETRFRELQKKLPKAGDIVECLDGFSATVQVEIAKKERQLFTYAVIDDDVTGWFLKFAKYGILVFIDRKDHEKVLNDSTPDAKGAPTIRRLRIIRKSVRGTSLIGELVDG